MTWILGIGLIGLVLIALIVRWVIVLIADSIDISDIGGRDGY